MGFRRHRNEQELRKHRCCFTGHRPEKLKTPVFIVKLKLSSEIKQAIKDGYVTFISGMSRGVDLWAAEIVIKERVRNPKIHLIAAGPFPGFENRWNSEDKDLYNKILAQADLVKFICKGYSHPAYQIRNEWMIDHSKRLIAVYNGESGGTRNTLVYASHVLDIEVKRIDG
ncbi:MAG: SLOG family protein [Oscillospiraceae bacterium]|nr:SLOG family protein [Oscillospiraceae bacterium]